MAAEDRLREATYQAWQTARFAVQAKTKKGMPKLQDALAEIGTRKREAQNVGQLRATLSILSGQYGIPLRKAGARV